MTRRIVWSLVAALALVVLVGYWFLQNFEQVPQTQWEGPQKEARRNAHLALERLFARLDRPIEHIKSPVRLDALAPNGVLMLDNNRRRNVDPARAQHLLEWVNGGGYLIVAAEYGSDDPLLKLLGVTPCREAPKRCTFTANTADDSGDEGDDWEDEESTPAPPTGNKTENAAQAVNVILPDSNVRYVYGYRYPLDGLLASTPAPTWTAGGNASEAPVLHFAWGRGQITVVDNLRFLGNWQLGEPDHAELIWALVTRYQPSGPVYLASHMEYPTLWQWLAESAWMALISGGLLIGLWLWRIVPRFGGWLPPTETERRDLLQHLAAIGRSVWREGGLAHWLTVVRQPLRQRIALRHPHLARMETNRQNTVLAGMADCAATEVRAALMPGTAPTPAEFTRAMQTLQKLDQQL